MVCIYKVYVSDDVCLLESTLKKKRLAANDGDIVCVKMCYIFEAICLPNVNISIFIPSLVYFSNMDTYREGHKLIQTQR